MKPIQYATTVLTIAMVLLQQGWSQTFDLRFVEVNYTGTICDIKIQINSNQSTFPLGTSSLVFTYSQTELTNPTILAAHNFSSGNYIPIALNTTQPPRVAINLELAVPPGLAVPLVPTDVVTIRFTKLGPVPVPARLQWVSGGGAPTVVFKDDETTIVPADSLIDLNCCPVPVQLTSFTARTVPGLPTSVCLDWRTISETNNYGFYVERKRNADSTFAEIPASFIAGHGTTNEPHDYTFTDNSPGATTVWYRLRQVDLDGTPHWTDPVQASGIVLSVQGKEAAPIEFALKQNYPNPFNPSTEIKFSVEAIGRTTLEVFNIVGEKVATLFDDVAEPGQYYKATFDGTNHASGIYLCRLQSGKNSDVKKLLIVK